MKVIIQVEDNLKNGSMPPLPALDTFSDISWDKNNSYC